MRKIYLIVIVAIFAIVMSIFFNKYTKNYFQQTSKILSIMKDIENHQYQLKFNVLKSSFYLYHNYDLIYKSINRIKKDISLLKKDLNKTFYPETYKTLIECEELIKKKENYIYDFETLNSAIKNSQIYIPSLALSYIENNKKIDIGFLFLLNKIISSVFLIKNSFDSSFISELKEDYNKLKDYPVFDKKTKKFKEIFLLHLKIFIDKYNAYLKSTQFLINDPKDKKLLEKLKINFIDETKKQSVLISGINIFLTALSLIMLAFIAKLIIRLDLTNQKLIKLQDGLKKSLITDDLTGLLNRKAFFRFENQYKEPTFILVDIDNFKNINDIYGSHIGDQLLIKFAHFLKDFSKENNLKARIFRLGADNFGLLYEDKKDETEKFVKNLIKSVEKHVFTISEKKEKIKIDISIDITVAVSFEKPLLEKADMALKYLKSKRKKWIVFSKELGLEERFEKNIKTVELIKYALNNDKIKLFFQPIFNNETGIIEKYECLLRIEDKNGKIILPSAVLKVAKESKYYPQITKNILKQAFQCFSNKKVEFSINLSAEDMTNKEISTFIYKIMEKYPETTKRVIFEIVESESIENYEEVYEFLKKVKKLGAKIAIDDFGSGYSNYMRIVKFSPDYIKIDGTLIRNLTHDLYTQIIVSTIVDFCGKLGIQTVAEFVENEEIYNIVKSYGIDYSQGFYLGKPEKCLLGEK